MLKNKVFKLWQEQSNIAVGLAIVKAHGVL